MKNDKKRLQDNIENVLNAIDNVVGYHHVAKRQKDLINKGVQGDLNTYIKSLSEVQSAVEFFAQVGFHKKPHHFIGRFHQPMKIHQFRLNYLVGRALPIVISFEFRSIETTTIGKTHPTLFL